MANIQAFRAIRYSKKAGDIQTLVCPPYDIISWPEREEFLAQDPHNIVALEKPDEAKGIEAYALSGDLLKKWLKDGILEQDERESLYLYRFSWQGHTLDGVIARVKLEEFSKGIILPHEETLSKAKEDRFRLMTATGCNFSAIYSLYNSPPGFRAPTAEGEALSSVTDSDGVTHSLWALSDKSAIDAYTKALANTKLYIADGHHRYETALRYRDTCRVNKASGAGEASDRPSNKNGCDYVMMLLVDMAHPGLLVLPTHRIVHSLDGFDASSFLRGCEEYFDVEPAPVEDFESKLKFLYDCGKKAFGFFSQNEVSAILTARQPLVSEDILPGVSPASRGLDVQLLHTLALERVLGIDRENMANQRNLRYTRDWSEALSAVRAGEANAAFMLNPTRVEEIRDVAAASEKMPQKSTYFYPKIITGLTVNGLGD